MIKFGLILLILFVMFCVLGIIENYDKKKKSKKDYKLLKIKIYDITCETCGQIIKDDDTVITFVDNNKTYISHATCCFVINEEKQIVTNYDGNLLVNKEDIPKHSVLVNENDKKLIEDFIK
jgi:hypothetical protein